MGQFIFGLPAGSADLGLSEMFNRYAQIDINDPYLKSLLVTLGYHLFVSSERDLENSLLSNIAGR